MVMSGQQEMYNHARDFREKVRCEIDSLGQANWTIYYNQYTRTC